MKLEAPFNIILIGMPGAGKSTLGVLLAKRLAKSFVDTDLCIQERAGKSLQDILETQGYLALRELEERVLLDLVVSNTVVATGGSVVYSSPAMAHLKEQGTCVYLRLSLAEVAARVHNLDTRGIAAAAGKTLADIYAERQPLYQEFADITVDCDGKAVERVLDDICGTA